MRNRSEHFLFSFCSGEQRNDRSKHGKKKRQTNASLQTVYFIHFFLLSLVVSISSVAVLTCDSNNRNLNDIGVRLTKWRFTIMEMALHKQPARWLSFIYSLVRRSIRLRLDKLRRVLVWRSPVRCVDALTAKCASELLEFAWVSRRVFAFQLLHRQFFFSIFSALFNFLSLARCFASVAQHSNDKKAFEVKVYFVVAMLFLFSSLGFCVLLIAFCHEWNCRIDDNI